MEVGVENRSEVYRKLESEIEDLNVLGQLHGVQENAFLIGQAMESIDLALPGKKGWIDMAEALLKRLHDERAAISGKVDTAGMDPDEAKIRNDQMGQVISLTEVVLAESHLEIDKMISRKEGLQTAENIAAQQFDRIQANHERELRIAAEDLEDRKGFPPGKAVQQDATENVAAGGNGEAVLDPIVELVEAKPARKKKTAKKKAKRKPSAKKS